MPYKEPPKEHKFTSDKQPTKEQREKAKETKKMRLRLKPFMAKYRNMSVKEFQEVQKDLKKRPDEYTMNDLIAINAVAKLQKDFRYYKDERDRVEGRAIEKQEITADLNEEKTIKGDISINHSMDLPDDRAAEILSILAKAGAIKSKTEGTGKAET